MALRTYLPGLYKRIYELNRYVKRYEQQVTENSTVEQNAALDGIMAYVPSALTLYEPTDD